MAVSTKSLIYAVFLCNIYSTNGNTVHNTSYIGCFWDAYDPLKGTTEEGALRVLQHAKTTLQTAMTIGRCIKFCTTEQEQMQYAGVETGAECHCGTAEAQYDLYGELDDSECMIACSGNPRQYCGNDFRIAVYNLTLVRCQLPRILGLDTSHPDFIPVYDNATFTCLPGYQLSGPDSVQCIFDDDITDIRWSSDLPQCLSIPTTASTTTTTTAAASTASNSYGPIIGIVVTLLALVAIMTIVLFICKRKNSENNLCCIGKDGRDMKNQDPDVAKTASDDKTYLDLNTSTMQESTYQGLVNPQDSAYQGLVNPQISTYQGLINPQEPEYLEFYAEVEPHEDQNKAHDTDQSEYQNVPDANAVSTITSHEGQVPIPPPLK